MCHSQRRTRLELTGLLWGPGSVTGLQPDWRRLVMMPLGMVAYRSSSNTALIPAGSPTPRSGDEQRPGVTGDSRSLSGPPGPPFTFEAALTCRRLERTLPTLHLERGNR
jgi:hypothetical protein